MMNRKNTIKFMLILMVSLLTSCLPQEKVTQCGSGEAYDATNRKCKTTLDATGVSINITNVTPSNSYTISDNDTSKTHSVSVADPYNNGFAIKWFITNQTNNTVLLGTGLSIIFNHTAFAAGNYVIEVQLLDSKQVNIIDSRSWSINVIDKERPSLLASTATPFTTTLTSAATPITAIASNPDGIASVNWEWFINGNPVAGENGNFSTPTKPLILNFDPSSSTAYFTGAGIYSVQLVLRENVSGNLYDSFTWSVQSNIPAFAGVSLGASAAFGSNTPGASSNVSLIDEVAVAAGGFKFDSNSDGDIEDLTDRVDFCVQVDNAAGVDGDGVFVDYYMDNVKISDNNPLATNTDFCLADGNAAYNYNLDEINDRTQFTHTLRAVIYDKYNGVSNNSKYGSFAELQEFVWHIDIRQENTKPEIIIDTVGTNLACTAPGAQASSGCSMTQDTAFQVAISVTDLDYASTDFSKFSVDFKLDNVSLDGAGSKISSSDCVHAFADTLSVAKYICTLTIQSYNNDSGEIDPTSANYTISASVTDEDSPFSAPLDSKVSNTVTWNISSVAGINSGVSAVAFQVAAGAPAANTSFVSKGATPGSAIALGAASPSVVTEGDSIFFNVVVNDTERDTHSILVQRCTVYNNTPTTACGTVSLTPVASVLQAGDTGDQFSTAVISHLVGQNTVIGSSEELVTYRVIVTDVPGGAVASDDDTIYAQVKVTNFNPDPVMNPTLFNPLATTAGLTVMSGYPFTIDPGNITDASDSSAADGDTVLYQWMIAIDTDHNGVVAEPFQEIDGATSRVLVWSPGPEIDFGTQSGTKVHLKLCIGDDGSNAIGASKVAMNAATDNCFTASLDSSNGANAGQPWEINVISNMVTGKSFADNSVANAAGGQLAVWIDPSTTNPTVQYKAYISQTNQLIVDKIVTTSTGSRGGSVEQSTEELASIIIDSSTDGNFSSNPVSHLSMTGDTVNKALYISYMALEGSFDKVHVRRIDISGDKTGFLHNGKFGFDPGYNSLIDNTALPASVSQAVSLATGQITFTLTGMTIGESIVLNTLFNGVSGTMTYGTHFCTTGCTDDNADALSLANAINASTDKGFQGFTAISSTNTVTLSGIVENDFLQASAGSTAIGSIKINTTLNSWVLPIIDHDLTGTDKNKVSIIQGSLGLRLADSGAGKSTLFFTNPAQEIANDIQANDVMILATKEYSTGLTRVYELNSALGVSDSHSDLFNSPNMTGLKVSLGKTTANTSAYILAKNIDSRFAFARIPSDGAGDFDFTSIVSLPELDPSMAINSTVTNYAMTAGAATNEAFLAMVDGTNNNAYLAKIKGTTPSINCNWDSSSNTALASCTKIQSQANNVVLDMPLALSDVLEDVTIGSAGAFAAENERDIMFIGLHIDASADAAGTDFQPIGGIINIQGETFTATNNDVGLKYTTPYVAP